MLRFFRQIRKNLMEQPSNGRTSKTRSYLFYAIGEIALVMIGILLALQVNNWNEARKEASLADQYLIGIKSDLYKDIEQIDLILEEHVKSISLMNSLDDSFIDSLIYEPEKYPSFFIEIDTTHISYLFYRGLSFRSIKGTYNSLISDGRTGLIKNRLIFEEVQQIYAEQHERLTSIYDEFKSRDELITWNYPAEKKYWTYADLKQAKKEKVFLDLSNFTSIRYFYSMHLYDLKEKSLKVIELIDSELNL